MSFFGRVERREIAALKAEADRLRGQRDEAYDAGQTLLSNQRHLAARCSALHDETVLLRSQLADAVARVGVDQAAEVERLTGELEKQRRINRSLHRQLDDALGLDRPEIAAGAGWRDRREDRARTGVRRDA